MDLDQAQETLAAVGSDHAPTATQLQEARAAFVSAAKTAKDQGDKLALTAMLEAIRVTDRAIEEATELEAKAAEELDALTKDFPELADEGSEELSAEAGAEASADEEAPRVLSVSEAAQRLGLSAPAAREDRIEVKESRQTLSVLNEPANDATWADLGNAFAKAAKTMLRSGRTTLATFNTDYANKLSGRQAENTRILNDLSRQAGDEAVIAAGGCCTLAEPIRDQPMLASLNRPIASSLPTVGSSAGAVTFFPQICLPQDGVGTWSCEDDEAVDAEDPETWKTCTEIDCDETQEVVLGAIYRCLTIGNFNHRFSPERWDAILHATAAMQARVAEQTLFSQIANDANTTAHTAVDTGSVYATVAQTFIRAAATIKQKQRYDGLRVKAIMPSWVKDAAAMDMLARAIKRGRNSDATPLETVLAQNGIDVTWSNDLGPIEAGASVDGPITEFPSTFDAVLYIDGGVFRLDGGELNLGTEIRDHDLNRQNKVATFVESFEAAVVRSCDTKKITVPVSICDEAPCTVAPGPGSSEESPLFTQEVAA